jgi:hypothetical protein
MEPNDSLRYSYKHVIGPYYGPDESNPRFNSLFHYIQKGAFYWTELNKEWFQWKQTTNSCEA